MPDEDNMLDRLRREARDEDERLPRYNEDRPGREANNGIRRRPHSACTSVRHDAITCEAAALPLADWCEACLFNV